MRYRIDIDYEKPYSIEVNSKRALRRKIRHLDKKLKDEDLPHCDVYVKRIKHKRPKKKYLIDFVKGGKLR